MPWQKRLFDISIVLLALPLVLVACSVIAVLIAIREGRPIFYHARRVGEGGRIFYALKFRTMRPVEASANHGVSGGNKHFRISKFSARLRRMRLDELPQLWNVLKGDMSLVGPRPPDPSYVEAYPDIYGQVMRSRPGLTGLATLKMHKFEDRVLKVCETAEETDTVYRRRCIPRKAKLDLLYQSQARGPGVVLLDCVIIWQSITSVLGR